ncbi:PXDN-like protein [Mya arenaria]|uniref:PXDN-like protein n=1 Tax=Mya arenaria TaxID=6604 RepID=A0ABY7EP12_MYAAR|nr:PXDN-like protein [Mya arenaria]
MFVHCPGNREQLNLLTAYVDGSNIYGSEQTEADDLRAHDGHLRGFLATSDGPIHPELPISTAAGEGEAACNNDGDDNFPCHQAGDFRVNEQPGLASMHTLWVREHNRVAGELVQNHGYQDDTEASSNELHHAARRIVIAEYQNIVYNGYLRSFMDAKIFDDFKLNSCMDGSCSYDDSLNPSITNEWGIANRTIETAVTENLFRSDVRNAFDLAALNIQRGRDHGVSYCATRKALGLKVPATFQEAENMQLFSRETIALLESCYDNICDIDLFTAIVAERPLRTRTNLPIKSDSPIAETLNHIQGDMYRKLKLGDRFWYEFQRAGLNGDQKRAIGRVTMSTIICDNVLTEGGDIQPDAFLVEGL